MRWRAAWWLGVLALLAPVASRAQTAGIDVQTFHPLADTLGGFTVASARPLGHLDVAAGLLTNYAAGPLRLRTVESGAVVRELVSDRVTADLLLALGLLGVVDLGVDLPVVVWNGGDGTIGVASDTLVSSGVGDLRLTARLGHVWGVFGAALVGETLFPTGDEEAFLGTGGYRGGSRAVFELDFRGVQAIVAVGARFQPRRALANLVVDDELTLGLAVVGRLRSIGLDLVGEASAWTRLAAPFERQNDTGLELRAGVRHRLPGDIVLAVGAGPGIVGGYGAPEWRAFLGLLYAPEPAEVFDHDGDGVPDETDACPDEPEDEDDHADADGCPDPDNDGDGRPDGSDRCPNQREDEDGFEDADGCPDPDNDGDGVLDRADACPGEPEDLDRSADDDGCPDPDNDGDGIPDVDDRCPDVAETVNEFEDDDGCPDPSRIVEVTCDRVAIRDPVHFEPGSDRIARESWPLLDEVAATILAAHHIRRVRVDGHTDSDGSDLTNLRLSQRRAVAVREYLIERGVPREMLVARGFGEAFPIESNRTDDGRAANRRVEFVILDQDPPIGCR